MIDRRKRPATNQAKTKAKTEPGQKKARKPTPLGTDRALTLPTRQRAPLELTYWDLWFALVAARDYGGELGRLAEGLGEDRGFFSVDMRSVERKRCHLRDLDRRLTDAGLSARAVLVAAGDLAQTEFRRARKRVLQHSEREREWSEAMQNTPRKWRFEHALRGFWPRFPVSPESYAKKVGAQIKGKSFYTAAASSRLSSTLDEYVSQAEKLSNSGKYAEAQALLRALMTAVIELMSHADDSYGSLGMSFREAFAAYLKIPLEKTGIDEEVFFLDLLDLLVWEDYGLTYEQFEGYFQEITPAQADVCIGHLRRQIDELKKDDLEYASEEALTLLGQVVAEQARFDQFEDLAREMASRHWQRIIRLADRAVKKRKRPLACQVFEAALTRGDHLDFLTKKYEQLKKGHWSPDPRK